MCLTPSPNSAGYFLGWWPWLMIFLAFCAAGMSFEVSPMGLEVCPFKALMGFLLGLYLWGALVRGALIGQWGRQSSCSSPLKVDSQTWGPRPPIGIHCSIVFISAPQPTACLAFGGSQMMVAIGGGPSGPAWEYARTEVLSSHTKETPAGDGKDLHQMTLSLFLKQNYQVPAKHMSVITLSSQWPPCL